MSEVMKLEFEGEPLTLLVLDGKPWFIATEVCRRFEIGNVTMALRKLDEDEKGLNLIETLGGLQQLNIISESGFYTLAIRCRAAMTPGTPAYRFRKWVTGEVLPSIRATGGYTLPGAHRPPQRGWNDLSDGERRTWLDAIKLVTHLNGKAAGRALWRLSPLPQVEVEAAPVAERLKSSADGAACLAWLLASSPPVLGGMSVGDAIHLATCDLPGREKVLADLAACGVKVLAEIGMIAVSNTHPALASRFVGTTWSKGWSDVLKELPGVHPAPTTMRFGGFPSKAAMVPLVLCREFEEEAATA